MTKSQIHLLVSILTLVCVTQAAISRADDKIDESVKYATSVPEGISQVESKSLTLLGSGLEDKKTGNWIKIACVGDFQEPSQVQGQSCNVLKLVFFKIGTDLAYYFGPSFNVKTERAWATSDDVRDAVKKIYMDFVRSHHQPFLALGLTAITVVSLFTATAPLFFVTIVVFGAYTGVDDQMEFEISHLSSAGPYTAASLRQSGEPKRIRHHMFKKLVKFESVELPPGFETIP